MVYFFEIYWKYSFLNILKKGVFLWNILKIFFFKYIEKKIVYFFRTYWKYCIYLKFIENIYFKYIEK